MSAVRAGRVRLPADIELEDRLAFGLTARQLAILGASALLVLGLYTLTGSALPLPIVAAVIVPVVVAGTVLAFGRHAGLSGDRLAICAARFLARPRRRVLAPEGLAPPLPGSPERARLTPLDLPVHSVLRSGMIALNDGGFALILRAAGTSFALRSEEEQAALVEAFGQFLNSAAAPIELCVRSEPVELEVRAEKLEQSAAELAQPALAEAAHAHARFLRELEAGGELRRREILLVLGTRAPNTSGAHSSARTSAARTALKRRASEAIELLRAAGVELQPLAGEEAARLLARTLDSPGPPAGCALDGVVTAC